MEVDTLPARLNYADWELISRPTVFDSSVLVWRDFDLWTVATGRGTFRTGGKSWEIGPGDCFLLPGGGDFVATREGDDPMLVYFVHFDYLGPDGEPVSPRTLDLPLHRRMDELSRFIYLNEAVIRLYRQAEPNPERATKWLLAALAAVAEQDQQPALTGPEREQSRAVEAICLEIDSAPGERHAVADMARRMNCSSGHFCRLFRRLKGMPPREYIMLRRMERAKRLLRTTGMDVCSIAVELGYDDACLFSRQFRSRLDMTPSQYRRGSRERTAP